MSQIELSYEDLRHEIITEIQKHDLMVLATSNGDFVSARTVLCIPDGLTLYCTSGSNKRKCWQIAANPNVALAAGNLQIEGVASLRGNPLAEENAAFIKTYRETQPNLYERQNRVFQRRKIELIEIVPKRIALWKSARIYNLPESSLDILNITKEEAHRVKTSDTGEAPAYRE